jgi:cytoskeletal protein RodZ
MATADRPLTDFGERLRRAREARGISLRQVSNVTRISVRALEAVERNDLTRLPGGIFTRAFVRAYASEVGLDPEAALRDFLAQCPDDASVLPVSGTDIVDGVGDRADAGPGLRRAALAVLLLAVAGAAAYGVVRWYAERPPSGGLTSGAPDSPRAERAAPPSLVATADAPASSPTTRPVPDGPAPAAPAEAVVRTANAPPLPASPSAPLTVKLVAEGPCWVSAESDHGATVQRLLAQGDAMELAAERTLVLRVGDAGALALTINGRAARPLGARGEVVTVQLSPETVQDLFVR